MTHPQTELPPEARPTPRAAEPSMFRSSWTFLRVRGVPLRVDATWLLIAALVFYMAFYQPFGQLLAGYPQLAVVAAAFAGTMLFFASVLAHELGHAITSLNRGLEVRGITLFLLGGVTESSSEARSARDEFVIVGIGPFISLVLAAAFGLLYTVVTEVAFLPPAAAVTGYLAWINLGLALFNVVPGYPLDGGRLLRSILWGVTKRRHASTRWAARVGQIFALGLIALGIYELFGGPGAGLDRLWTVLIGVFLFRGAGQAHAAAVVQERLEQRTARDVMGSVPETLAPDTPLAEAVQYVERRPSLLWPVGNPVVGGLTLSQIDAVPAEDWPSTTAGQIAHPQAQVAVAADESLAVILQRLPSAPGEMLLVVEGGRAVGLLTPSLITDAAIR